MTFLITLFIGFVLTWIGYQRNSTPIMIVGVAFIGAAVVFPVDARAHEAHSGMKYDAWCCQGNAETNTGDCQAIPDSAVKITNDGYEITIEPGQHRLVTRTQRFKVAFGAARQSTDDNYHLCVYPTEDDFRCFYAPPMGS